MRVAGTPDAVFGPEDAIRDVGAMGARRGAGGGATNRGGLPSSPEVTVWGMEATAAVRECGAPIMSDPTRTRPVAPDSVMPSRRVMNGSAAAGERNHRNTETQRRQNELLFSVSLCLCGSTLRFPLLALHFDGAVPALGRPVMVLFDEVQQKLAGAVVAQILQVPLGVLPAAGGEGLQRGLVIERWASLRQPGPDSTAGGSNSLTINGCAMP